MPETKKPLFFYGYTIVGAAFLILAVAYGARSVFGIFFKPMLADFGWTRAVISGAFSVSLLVEGLMGIVMGGFNDRFGPRVVLTVCGVLLGLGFFLMSFTGTLWQFYLFYGLIIGAGLGGSFVPLVSTVARWFVRRRSMMTGIAVAGIGAGALLLPPMANWLIENYGWRQSYVVMGALVLVIVVVSAWFLRRDPSQKGEQPYGADEPHAEITTLKGAAGFTLRQAVVTSQFWMVYFMLFCFGFNAFSFGVHFVPHVTDLGISASNAAMIVSVTGGVSIAGSLLLGNIADRIGNRQVFAIGFIGLVVYYAGLLPAYQLWALLLLAAVSSFTTGGAGASESPLVASLFGLKAHGLIYGVVGTGFTLGAGLGPYLTGYIYDARQSYDIALGMNGVIAAAGACLALLLKPTKKI